MFSTLNPEPGSFNYFQSFFEHTRQNAILIMDETGTVTGLNTAFTNAYGFTNEDIVGKNFAILFTEADQRKKMPEGEVKKVLEFGQAADNNFLVDKYQGLTWVSGESILVKNADGNNSIVKVIQNINSQKLSENAILSLNSFNESILGAIADAVMVINDQLNIVKVNSAFNQAFENKAEVQSGKLNIATLIAPFDINNELLRSIQQLTDTGKPFKNYCLEMAMTKDEKKIYEISGCMIEQAGAKNNWLLVAHDITAQKQAEIEREDIIGFVAHELRNPLANIVLCNEMMSQLISDNTEGEMEEYLNRSKNNVMRLNKMIGELYDATKLNSGNFELEKTWFDFEDMIEEALDTLEVLHPDYSIIVEGECSSPVYGDRYRLIQVVTNFLSNGIKYSNNKTQVVIHLREENGLITVAVKDEGLGIPAKQLPYVFDRFFRAEKTRNMEGIGLGLYL